VDALVDALATADPVRMTRAQEQPMPGLEDLYREIILDHYRNPRNRGELPIPPAHAETGFNPLCGDEITLYVQSTATRRRHQADGTGLLDQPVLGVDDVDGGQRQEPGRGPGHHPQRSRP
jgi:hypothetical protein